MERTVFIFGLKSRFDKLESSFETDATGTRTRYHNMPAGKRHMPPPTTAGPPAYDRRKPALLPARPVSSSTRTLYETDLRMLWSPYEPCRTNSSELLGSVSVTLAE